jgi:hypothetical protein
MGFLMITRLIIALLLVLFHGPLRAEAQTQTTDIMPHVVWERELANLDAWGGAATDKTHSIWFASDYRGENRLVHIAPNGDLLSSDKFPSSLDPKGLSDNASFSLAVSPTGTLGLLAYYSHSVGKAIYNDGASFARIEGGKVGVPIKVAGPGPEYKGFLAIGDDRFLVMGDQDPLVLMSIDSQGKKIWRRSFSWKWDLPEGAALENGASCIASPNYTVPRVRVLRIDSAGNVQRQAEIAAHGAAAASGPDGGCAVLYHRDPGFKREEFSLTLFDSSFKRRWTVPVKLDAPEGGSFYLVKVSDGFVVVTDGNRMASLFVAKYDFTGRLLWSIDDPSRHAPSLVVADGDGFYLLGAALKDRYSLSVIRGR